MMAWNRSPAAVAVLVAALGAATLMVGQSPAAGGVAGSADEPWQGTLTVVNQDGNAAPDLFTAQADLHKSLAAVPTCFGRAATIVGTDASETLVGTDGPDVIVGGGGSDTINAGPGDDWVCDASGVDNLNTLRGGPGNDHVRGALTLVGNGGNDVLIVAGTVGSTVLVDGGPGNDTLRAPVLKAVFVPGPGRDRVVGNAVPNDVVSYARSRTGVSVDLATGTSTGQGTDALSKVEGVIGTRAGDVVRGNSRSNEFFGLGGGDLLKGRGGQDFLHGGAGADRLDGGAGQDFCDGTAIDRRLSCEHRL